MRNYRLNHIGSADDKNKYISFANRPERRIAYHAGRYFPVQGRVFYDMALFVGSTLPTIWAECIIDWRHLYLRYEQASGLSDLSSYQPTDVDFILEKSRYPLNTPYLSSGLESINLPFSIFCSFSTFSTCSGS